jgi:hypothetical protein
MWRRNIGCIDESGFTLVETIVASVILFTCLSAAALSYQTSVDLVTRAESAVRIASVLTEIRSQVREKITSGTLEGKDEYAPDVRFGWKAVLTREARNITGASEEITGGLEYGRFQMTLYSVTLVVTCQMYGRERVSDYEYQELTWAMLQ